MIFWIILVGLKCNHKSPHHESACKREAEESFFKKESNAFSFPRKPSVTDEPPDPSEYGLLRITGLVAL